MGSWHVSDDRTGDRIGPLSTQEVVRGLSAGQIPPHARICPSQGGEWSPVTSILSLDPARPSDGFANGPSSFAQPAPALVPSPSPDEAQVDVSKVSMLAVAVSAGAGLIGVVFSAVAQAVFGGVFGQRTKAAKEYVDYLSGSLPWRISVLFAATIICMSLGRKLRGWAPIVAMALCSLLVAQVLNYQAIVICIVAIMFARPADALLMIAPAVVITSGLLTKNFSSVPFESTDVDNPALHIIVVTNMAFWMFGALGMGLVGKSIVESNTR